MLYCVPGGFEVSCHDRLTWCPLLVSETLSKSDCVPTVLREIFKLPTGAVAGVVYEQLTGWNAPGGIEATGTEEEQATVDPTSKETIELCAIFPLRRWPTYAVRV